jgi:hypothetical protein
MEFQLVSEFCRVTALCLLVNGSALGTIAAKPEGSGVRVLTENQSRTSAVLADTVLSEGCHFRSDGDRRWDEILATMTDEDFEALDAMFTEDDRQEDTPLDFTGR